MKETMSAARRHTYDILGPYFNPDYVASTDPARQQATAGPYREASFVEQGLESATGRMPQQVRALDVRDTPGLDMFDPTMAGGVKAASGMVPGMPRRTKEVMDFLKMAKTEGWNEGQVVKQLEKLGHNVEEFGDAIRAMFGKSGLDPQLRGPMAGPIAEYDDLLRGARNAPPEQLSVSQRMRQPEMGPHQPSAFGDAPMVGETPLALPPTPQPAVEVQPSKAPTFHSEQKDMKGNVISRFFTVHEDVVDPNTGKRVFKAGTRVSEQAMELYGLKPEARKAERLPDEFEKLLMKQDPNYVGGKAARKNPFEKAEFANEGDVDEVSKLFGMTPKELRDMMPKAGPRADPQDIRDNLQHMEDAADEAADLNEIAGGALDDAYGKINPNQHEHLQNFLDDIKGTNKHILELLEDARKKGADENTVRELLNLWEQLGGDIGGRGV